MLPGYAPVASATSFHEDWVDEIPKSPGLNLLQMMDAAKDGKLKALYVVGSNPIARYNIDPFALSKAFVVVQDMFLTETAAIADVVLPVANAYEKGGTFTNTCGDLQMLKKAGEFAGVRNDFECIVRIADRMGYDVHKLVPFGGGGTRADMGQSARRAVGRSRPPRGVACRAQPRAEDEPVRSDRHAGRDSAAGSGIRHLAARPAQRSRRAHATGADHRRDRLGTSRTDPAVERHAVHFGHAGPLFAHAEHGDGALSTAPADMEVAADYEPLSSQS